jgi:DNA-binding MarR family transcriptional regulator
MVHRFSRKFFATLLEALDLPEVAFPLLMRLLHHDAMSQDELADGHLIDKSTVARTIVRMEDAGLVIRETDEADRRVKRVRLTERARALEPQIRRALEAWEERLLEGFGPDERDRVLDYMQRMAGNARKHWDLLESQPDLRLSLPDEEQ